MDRHNPRQLALMAGTSRVDVVSQHQFLLFGRWVTYTVRRRLRRRRFTLLIDHNGLCIRAPGRASQDRIESLLALHRNWISLKLAEWEARRPPPFAWQSGAVIMVMGQPMKLSTGPGRTVSASDRGHLYVATDAADSNALAAAVVAWLRDVAYAWFERRTAHYAPLLCVPMPTVRLSNARTRWGACHPVGRIHLNWRLIQMPPRLIDYVVVHELAHLHEPNHSPRFWRRVNDVLPDHKQRRKTLRCEGRRYLIPET